MIREISVIPKPQSVAFVKGGFTLSHRTALNFDQADIKPSGYQIQVRRKKVSI
jgi:hypothetical protein